MWWGIIYQSVTSKQSVRNGWEKTARFIFHKNTQIELIGKSGIKFYSADGKRKYSFNGSIEHIKDWIGYIKANKSIINNWFYNNMINNNNIAYNLMMVFLLLEIKDIFIYWIT